MQGWRAYAKCLGKNTGLFFPNGTGGRLKKGEDESEKNREARERLIAKMQCDGCPVALDCLRYAVTHNEKYGVWGGMSSQQRMSLRRRIQRRKRSLYRIETYLSDKEVRECVLSA